MQFINQVGAFTSLDAATINANFAALAGLTQGQGTVYFLDAINGNDGYNGLAPTLQADGLTGPKGSLPGAYAAAVAGHNDCIAILANGGTASTVRVDNPFTWAKDATHLIGVSAPVLFSPRARLAPSSATAAFKPFFTLSGSGCIFQNVGIFDSFTTGTTAQICMLITGSRNAFQRCQIAGMGDSTSATDTGSRSLKIGASGSGENLFEDCVIGLDTTARTVANASLEFAGATPRNLFRRCEFPVWATGSGSVAVLGTGAACLDRTNFFEQCRFINSIKSGSGTAQAAVASLTSGASGGLLVFSQCMAVGFTKWGDVNALANSYIDAPAISAAAGGLGLNPA
jgi:hypothetical protein